MGYGRLREPHVNTADPGMQMRGVSTWTRKKLLRNGEKRFFYFRFQSWVQNVGANSIFQSLCDYSFEWNEHSSILSNDPCAFMCFGPICTCFSLSFFFLKKIIIWNSIPDSIPNLKMNFENHRKLGNVHSHSLRVMPQIASKNPIQSCNSIYRKLVFIMYCKLVCFFSFPIFTLIGFRKEKSEKKNIK